jgi:hypothetical protein
MVTRFGYRIQPPAISDTDTVKLRLYIKVNDVELDPVELAPTADYELIVKTGDHVILSYTALDSQNNESEHSSLLQFTAVDDIPPSAPGAPIIAAHRQLADVPAPVTPPSADNPVVPPLAG